MSQEDALSPTRITIFRQIDTMLKEAKTIEDARAQYRSLVLNLVLGETTE